MPTQYENIMAKLGHLEKLVMQVIHMMGPGGLDTDSFQEGLLQLEGEEEPLSITTEDNTNIREPESVVLYKDMNNELQRLPVAELPGPVRRVREIAIQYNAPYQIYEDPTGNIRIATDNEVVARYHAESTPQPGA